MNIETDWVSVTSGNAWRKFAKTHLGNLDFRSKAVKNMARELDRLIKDPIEIMKGLPKARIKMVAVKYGYFTDTDRTSPRSFQGIRKHSSGEYSQHVQ